ncbi:hypothetical protein ACFXJ5_30900 [Streptomyces sp. NPDC059373]
MSTAPPSHRTPEDVADTIGYVVTRPRHVAMSEVLMRPGEQERRRSVQKG